MCTDGFGEIIITSTTILLLIATNIFVCVRLVIIGIAVCLRFVRMTQKNTKRLNATMKNEDVAVHMHR